MHERAEEFVILGDIMFVDVEKVGEKIRKCGKPVRKCIEE